ncbi:MAG: hypothetical protein QOD99_1553 [Chthoniobacter sp.]|nr:hypothetical protein [Chthoniobacter sp.]
MRPLLSAAAASVLFGIFKTATLFAAPVLESNVERPLRYRPDGTDFVIENGSEFFNRPLYGTNSAFRVDAGDRPECSLYLPGRGGNLRIGLKSGTGAKWLFDADKIVARYRPGSMLYEIHDSMLGAAVLKLVLIPFEKTEGVILHAELEGKRDGLSLICVYGGASGQRGKRDGDIGCESVPVSEFFQLKASACKGNEFTIQGSDFTMRSKPATIIGLGSSGSKNTIADATNWSSLSDLMAVAGRPMPELPVVVNESPLQAGKPVFFALQRIAQSETSGTDLAVYQEVAKDPAAKKTSPELLPRYKASDLPRLQADAEKHRQEIAGKIVVETPDPFVNAAAAALCVAADGVWDGSTHAFMHGAVAWRTKLLGWRGPYSGDALGWHERTREHLMNWFPKQNAAPISTTGEPAEVPPDQGANLARNEPALHSSGDLSNAHYDMNLPAIDVLFRHLLWTGDLDFARKSWPVIERHLAWERRLFRRPFGPEKLPLYEAYCCIWASDDLQYSGGGATHATAYNFYHNKMAARIAKLIGEDATPYEREADLILRALHENLWLADRGWFAESKDLLGLQRTHDSSALWTFYHTVDSEVPTPTEAWQMSQFVDDQIAHIPIRGPGVPDENLFTLPTTNWMPYTWSTNNVVMAESAHTALAFWQSGRGDGAFRLFKGCVLDSMFMGLCPGNVGMCTQFDMARGESQRDFADGVGMTSRALVEGLFGIKPDALSGELLVRPGFPVSWDHAEIRHPDFAFSFLRHELTETFSTEMRFPKPMALRLRIPALRNDVASVTVDGKPAKWTRVAMPFGTPLIEIAAAPSAKSKIIVTWTGAKPVKIAAPPLPETIVEAAVAIDWTQPVTPTSKLECVSLTNFFNDDVTQIFKHDYLTPRSPYCSLAMPKQGIGGWCEPKAAFAIDDSGLRAAAARNSGRLILPNGVPFQTSDAADTKNIGFVSQWENFPRELAASLSGKASRLFLLMAGSTNQMQSRIDNGEVIVTYADGTTARLALRNPENWWPIDQDYLIDDFAFRRPGPIPPRVNLKTGEVRILDLSNFKGKGGKVEGGAATVLDLALDPTKELKSLTVRALSNEVVIGLMSATLARP